MRESELNHVLLVPGHSNVGAKDDPFFVCIIPGGCSNYSIYYI